MKKSKGFTLIELVLVITLLGILAVVAFPRFFNLTTGGRQSARDGVVAAVRSGAALFRANDLVQGGAGAFPTTLDSATNGAASATNTFFNNILDQPITDGRWSKAGLIYTYDDGDAATANVSYTYSPATGTFQ